jgi:hypothetical protein
LFLGLQQGAMYEPHALLASSDFHVRAPGIGVPENCPRASPHRDMILAMGGLEHFTAIRVKGFVRVIDHCQAFVEHGFTVL